MTLITLRGGLTVRADAIALGCQVEAICSDEGDRDTPVLVATDGVLSVSRNASRLPPAMREAIKQQKTHLLALAAYQAPEPC